MLTTKRQQNFVSLIFLLNCTTKVILIKILMKCSCNFLVRSRTLLQVKDDYLHDEQVNTPKINPNGSELLMPSAIELDWEGEARESLSELNTDVNKDSDSTQYKEKNTMRTERR